MSGLQSTSPSLLRVFLVDDEPLALRRLSRLLHTTGRVEIVGSATDPESSLALLREESIDLLFLDIQMPGLSGFELLECLPSQPLVIFTTAYDRYALQAFEVNSIDYLLKPVEIRHLRRALDKVERLQNRLPRRDFDATLRQLAITFQAKQTGFSTRIASRMGDHVQFVEVARITHFFSKDKFTYAATPARDFVVDHTIAELEQKLDPRRFIRVHRSILLNMDYVHEIHSLLGGRVLVRLRDEKRTELTVARDRVSALKERLEF